VRRIERPRNDRARLSSTLCIEFPLFFRAAPGAGDTDGNAFFRARFLELPHRFADGVAVPPCRREPAQIDFRALTLAWRKKLSAATRA
jgi:hypothetical protein